MKNKYKTILCAWILLFAFQASSNSDPYISQPKEKQSEIIFLFNSVADFETLRNDFSMKAEVVLIDSNQNGLDKMVEIMDTRREVEAIHILSHGNSGSINLGSVNLNNNNVNTYTNQLTVLGRALSKTGDILIYGCNVAKGYTGKALIRQLSLLTHADIAASNDLTGNTVLGCNWDLELQTGYINASVPLSGEVQKLYGGVLVTIGTADGTYDFGTLGAANSGGTGYKTQGDKFVVSNVFLSEAGEVIYLNNGPTGSNTTTGSVEWKAEGGTTMKTFTFENMTIGSFTTTTTLTQFNVVLKNTLGATIASHTFSGSQAIGTADFTISNISFSPAWPAGGHDNVAEIAINYTTTAPTSNFEFRSITLANISNTASTNTAPTASSFTASPVYQGTAYAFATANLGYSDGDGDPLDHIRVTAIPNGTLWVDANADNIVDGGEDVITNGDTVSKANLDAGYLKYLNTSGTSTSFTFDVNDGTDYSAATYTATITVTSEPTVTLSLNPASSISENGGSTGVWATLSHSFNKTVTVNLSTSGTAAGTDYSLADSSISIIAGNTVNSVALSGQNDILDEDNETVIIDILSVTNGTESGIQQVTCTLTDDDATPTVSFTSASQASANEKDTMTVTAQLSAASGRTVTVPFTVNGSSTATGGSTDYSISSSPLTITAGSTTANISLILATDALDEDDETVIINMGTPVNATQGATTTHTATITDDDATPGVSFTSASQASVSEMGAMTITAQLSATSGRTVTVPFTVNGASTATGSSTDYSISSSPLTISAGSTTANITITVSTDALDEDDETVIVGMGTVVNATQGATTSHTATITDDDSSPEVVASQSFSIDENSTGLIGTIVATDADAGTSFQSWTIATNVNGDGDGNNAFAINPGTGQLSVNDADDLDREATDQLVIKVTVGDGTNTSSAEDVVINLNDVNDVVPVITSLQEFSIPENKVLGAVIDTVRAMDGDITPTTLQSWVIVTNVNPDLDANNAFSIDAATGALKVNDTGDLASGASHSLGITVSDGVNTSLEQVVKVNIMSSNTDPVITSGATVSVNENTTAVMTVTATDADGSDVLKFSISGGADKDLFKVDSMTGELSFKLAPDFEMPTDADLNNSYVVAVKVDDQKTGIDQITITVQLENSNDNAPVLRSTIYSINEDAPKGTVVDTLDIFDADGAMADTFIVEVIKGNEESIFSFNPSTLEIIVNKPELIDYEVKDSFLLDLTINDGVHTVSASITIKVNDVAESAIYNTELSVFKVYPNPVSDRLIIESEGYGSLILLDLMGKVVMETTSINHCEFELDLSPYKEGVYYLLLKTGKRVEVQKISISK